MASVYKTISAAGGQEKESGERKNKQRVLILVCDERELTCKNLHMAELPGCDHEASTFATRSLLVDVSGHAHLSVCG